MKSHLALILITLLLTETGIAFCNYDSPARPEQSNSAQAAGADERGIVALDQSLRDLSNPLTVMCVAAHPDDADFATLAYYRKRLGARAVIVYATRGEETPSPVRGEIGRELGVVRTREAVSAARVAGADVYFLNLPDFGHSKSAEETLSLWGRDEALVRLVSAIRLLRPDVIITSHTAQRGDGQHQAIARLTRDAFDSAADVKVAPEAGYEAWQARRLFQVTDTPDADVIVNLNEYDRARGRTYREIGRDARLRLASYGLAIEQPADEQPRYYKLALSATGEQIESGASLIDKIPLPENVARAIRPPVVGDLPVTDAVSQGEKLIEALREKLEEKRAEGPPEQLRDRYGASFFRVVRFIESLERALALALGLDLKVTISDSVLVRDQKLVVRVSLGGSYALLAAFHVPEQLPASDKKLAYRMSETVTTTPRAAASKEFGYEVPKDAPATLPRAARLYDEQYYPVGSALPGAVGGEPFGNRLLVFAEVALSQVTLPVAAEVRFDVAPAVEISTIPFAIVKDWSKPRDIEFPVHVRNRTAGALAGVLWVVPLALSDDNYEPLHLSFSREDEEVTVNMKLRLPILKPPLAPDVLIEFRREKPAPPDPLGSAKTAVKAIEFEVAENLRVGFIAGVDRWLAGALAQLGVEHKELSATEIKITEHGNATQPPAQASPSCADLSRFDAIVVDERAYFLRPDVLSANNCLLEYVKRGGNLVVLGQQPDDLNLLLARQQLAPYSMRLSSDRVTVESTPVKVLDEAHALVSKPNQITAKDFEGWTAERAYFVPRDWAAEFTPLTEMSDPGEEPQRGALLVARYGEGSYVYSTLALRRQMIEANPGAYRLFANLVSYSKNLVKTGEPIRVEITTARRVELPGRAVVSAYLPKLTSCRLCGKSRRSIPL